MNRQHNVAILTNYANLLRKSKQVSALEIYSDHGAFSFAVTLLVAFPAVLAPRRLPAIAGAVPEAVAGSSIASF